MDKNQIVKCRFCGNLLEHTFIDLGTQPLCESYLKQNQLNEMEPHYPLHVYICSKCFLVQLMEYVPPENIFSNYAYFSSFSDTWLEHAKRYVEHMQTKFGINKNHFVCEIASNDGYLLQYFKKNGIPVLGIEPAKNIARHAVENKNINTESLFFGINTATHLKNKYGQPDLLIGNNVLAHVPDINDFVGGMKLFLSPAGIITLEFPHLQKLIERNQFDTIYHEHYSYLSLNVVKKIFEQHGLKLWDVEELKTHGGSLRIYVSHEENDNYSVTEKVKELLNREIETGFETLEYYTCFKEKVEETKRNILSFLIEAKRNKKTIVGYGAPGKGNTLLNYCGIRTDFLDFTVDKNPCKHYCFLPGTRIPVFPPEQIEEKKPDYIFILPWNLKDEIISQLNFARKWGAQFIVPIPELSII